ncbi:MAG: ATP-dependent Clp protease adaptor ClpS [Bacteroidales bacterium]|nr:ATP-dependent Clp protease adaptor ClpS [Bacteroidales bacterium]
MTKSKPKISTESIEDLAGIKAIILYNDEYNTFDFVIDTLIEVCEHDPRQAEQCAFITHLKGKCDVKSGSYTELKPVEQELLNRGLTANIE